MRRLFLIAAALALLVGVTGAYAWDQQATDDQMNYQSTHGQSMPTADWPNEATGRY
jgi:phosphoglycerate-specific signal transduction histidine kinase